MKKLTFLISLLLLASNCKEKETSFEEEIKMYQYVLNVQFADKDRSPLLEEDRKVFKKLDFFSANESFKVIADIELTPNSPSFEMKTNTERIPVFKKYAIASFTIQGKKYKLGIYQEQKIAASFDEDNQLFLPFYDQTNGITTYGGGRYIDLGLEEITTPTITIDFNKAYNPYCVYNNKFSCPIPPVENTLPIEVNVGMKMFTKVKN